MCAHADGLGACEVVGTGHLVDEDVHGRAAGRRVPLVDGEVVSSPGSVMRSWSVSKPSESRVYRYVLVTMVRRRSGNVGTIGLSGKSSSIKTASRTLA